MTIVAAKMRVEIGADTRGAEDGMARVQKGLGQLGDAGKVALGTVLGNMITSAGRQLIGLGGEALSAYGDFERLGSSLQQMAAKELLNTGGARSMQDALGKTSGTAAELQGWIQKLAIQSPFTQQGVSDAFRMSMAYGFTTKESKRLTQAMIDFAAGSGATEYTMSKIALALGQIRAKGKLAGGEVLQLTEAGLGVNEILARAFNKSTSEIVTMREQGLIPAGQAIEAIVSSLERDFGGAAARQAGTIAGLVSSLEDLKAVGLREAFGPVFREFQPDLDRFVQSLQDPKTLASIRKMGEDFAATARVIVTKGGEIFGWFQSLEGGTQGVALGIGMLALNAGTATRAMSGIYNMASGIPAMVNGISTAWKAWNAGLTLTTSLQAAGLGTMAITLGAIALATAAVVGVWVAWNENIAKTNNQGIEATGSAMAKMLQGVAADGGSAAAVAEEFGSAYARMNAEIEQAGFAGLFINRSKMAKENLSALSSQLISMNVGYDAYNQRMLQAARSTGTFNELLYRNIVGSGDQARLNQYLSQTYGILSQAQYRNAMAAATDAANTDDISESLRNVVQDVGWTKNALSSQGQQAQLTADQISTLKGAWDKLQTAQKTFNQSFGDQVVNKLEQAGIKGNQLSAALGTVDKTLGTNYVAQRNANQALDEAIKNYKNTGNIDAFNQALQGNKSEWEKLNDELMTARGNWNEFVSSIAAADGMSVEIVVNMITNGTGGGNGDRGLSQDCFIGDTPVNTPEGPRRIDEIRAGDLVLLKTHTGEVIPAEIGWTRKAYRIDLVQVMTSNGQKFACAPNHQWKVKRRGWIWAKYLNPGDELYHVDDQPVSVLTVEPYPGKFAVYHVNVMHPEHTFLVGGIVVHNVDRKAVGGPVFGGKPYLVGEEGPEMFIPTSNGAIATHSMTEQMLAALVDIADQMSKPQRGGGMAVPIITITESSNPRRTARSVGAELGKLQRRR